ncbi:amino acid adenylation domain-containing protein [Algoriphagus lutimaris]|uniref:polyketide synthase n=1 Tax=Algoriphagus lutimaris TaxID=613197 RepID=UPI00196A1EB4|nr:polyketide synthase [Algoriphagus lutimaris]MBN3518769.1 amino acid adenylation domain-containing protein [Algoriphagus lutimaris]
MENFSTSTTPNIFDLLKRRFEEFRKYDALVHNDEFITYGKLEILVDLVAQRIRNEAPEEKLIAISCSRSVKTIINMLGVLAAGKAYLPLDFDQPTERLAKIVSETNVRFGLQGLDSEDFASLSIKTIEGKYRDSTLTPNYTSDLAYVLFTSGTTGMPKGIEVCSPSLVNLVNWQLVNSQSGPGFKTLHFARLTFDISFQEIFTTLVSGGTLYIQDNEILKDPYQLLQFIQNKGINRLFVPFIALQGLANAAVSYKIFPDSIREIMTCGEQLKVSSTIREFFQELRSCRFYNQYGPTETTIIVSQKYLEDEPSQWEDLPSIGWPISNVEMLIVSPEGKSITTMNKVGEIYITGDCLARGYYQNEELTNKLFVELNLDGSGIKRYYKSGDLAEWNVDGSIKFLGRVDDQVKINGHRVELGEIEVNASKINGIEENAVVIGHFKDGQNYVVLFYKTTGVDLKIEEIKKELRKSIPEYMIPYKFIRIEEFPRSGSGKIDRKALKNSLSEKKDQKVSQTKVDTNYKEIITGIWKDLLQETEFNLHSNFFQLGGSSILAQKLSLAINDQLKTVFPVALIYQNPTLGKQISFLKGEKKGGLDSPEKLAKKAASDNRDVAVIAMSGRFPGANDTAGFWEMIKNKKEGITHFTLEEIDPLVRHEAEESNYIKSRGVVADYDKFDSKFFGMNPKLAEIMDPQQRKFLEISHEVLEKAGWIANRPDFRIGVFAGTNNNTYYNRNVVFDHEATEIFGPNQVMSLNEKDYVASRVAFQLNLTGPAVSVYTACSTSLLAVAHAVMSIRSGQCTAAIAGGSSITFPANSGQRYQEGAIFSIDGHCKPFDSEATGTMFCDGAGAVLLKDYEQAVKDGDKIYAVIKGIGISNDGFEKASFTSPSVRGEASAIRDAILDAQIKPEQIGYVETHGTATPIGDPIEVEGLKLAFGEGVSSTCAIGSVKSNVGHLTAAAGIAGFIKTVYALHERTLPASLGFVKPNPEIKFEGSPFYVNNETKSWASDTKRIAGVSSFGFGGTNVHVILEEADPEQKVIAPKENEEPNLFVFSAKSESSVKDYAKKMHAYVQENPDLDLQNLHANLANRYLNYGVNLHFSASKRAELIKNLEEIEKGMIPVLYKKGEFKTPVFLIPGQGSQYVGMGKDFYGSNQVFKDAFDQCCKLFDSYLDSSLKEEIFNGAQENLSKTYLTQPAIFTVSFALAKMLVSKGFDPVALCGHSIGEYVAAHLAGIFSLEDAVKVVAYRGKLIYDLPTGQMLSVRSQLDIVKEILPDELSIAAHNAPNLCVVSGEHQVIEEFQKVLEEYGIANQVLKTSHAFHSKMMDGALDDFSKVLESVRLNIPQIPIKSTQTGAWLTDAQATSIEYWVDHIRNAVLFNDSAKALLEELEDSYFIEVGPGNVLSSLMQQQPEAKDRAIVHTLSRKNEEDEFTYLMNQIGRLISFGATIDQFKLNGIGEFSFLDIPTYSFEPKLCWTQKGALLNPAFSKSLANATRLNSLQENKQLEEAILEEEEVEQDNFEKIKEMLESASGVKIQRKDIGSSFFELGLDSLVLTQFTFSIKKEFGVTITFRQINDDLNTPGALLSFIQSKSPKPVNKPKQEEVKKKEPVAEHKEELVGVDVIQMIQQQLNAIQTQISQLQTNGGGVKNSISKYEKPKVISKTVPAEGSSSQMEEEIDPSNLSKEAQEFFGELKEKYQKRTSKSKDYHDSHNGREGLEVEKEQVWSTKRLNYPIISKFSDGSKLIDLDGNEYLDWHFSYGSKLFGYNADFIKKALKTQISDGLEFGTHLDQEKEVIRKFKRLTQVKEAYLFDHFSEALLKAITGCQSINTKKLIAVISRKCKTQGSDSHLPCGSLGNTECLDFLKEHFHNDLLVLTGSWDESLEILQDRSSEIGTVLYDVRCDDLNTEELGVFLNNLRKQTLEEGMFLVLNEVLSGFNTYSNGVSHFMTSKPDVVVFGNLIGEGLHLGILGDYSGITSSHTKSQFGMLQDLGEYTGDAFVLAATVALLKEIEERGPVFQDELSKKTDDFVARVNELFEKYNSPYEAANFRSIWRIKEKEHTPLTPLLFVLLRYEGVHMMRGIPCYFTEKHTRIDIEQTLVKLEKALALMIENDLVRGDLPDLEELVMDTHYPPFPGAKIGLDSEGNPMWVSPKENN